MILTVLLQILMIRYWLILLFGKASLDILETMNYQGTDLKKVFFSI